MGFDLSRVAICPLCDRRTKKAHTERWGASVRLGPIMGFAKDQCPALFIGSIQAWGIGEQLASHVHHVHVPGAQTLCGHRWLGLCGPTPGGDFGGTRG